MIRMPKLEQFEIKKYWQIFSGLKPQDNKLSHDQVAPILHNSKLDSSILNKIWFIADIDDDDNLDFEEFVICMRMIFDMVNKNIDSVPDELPDWLVPGSKAKLVAERKKRKQAESIEFQKSQPEVRSEEKEPPKLDWYISPSNKSEYETVYSSCNLSTDGTVTFPSMSNAVRNKYGNVTSSEVEQAWKLVNPRNLDSIDKDPALYFIHILKQKNDLGCHIPYELPTALSEICNKERVSYDLKSEQGAVKRTPLYSSTSSSDLTPQRKKEGTDFTATEGTDWEVVRLQRELANLETELSQVSHANRAPPLNASTRMIRQQFEELLKYKQDQLVQGSKNTPAVNIRGVTEDLDSIEQQVSVLEQYLSNKKLELQNLQVEIQALKG